MPKEARNPGLSEKAWQKLHELAVRFQIKYAEQIAARRAAKEESKQDQKAV